MSSKALYLFAGVSLACTSAAAVAGPFGAIAYNRTTKHYATSQNKDSYDSAANDALNRCGSGCELAVWVQNGCASIGISAGSYGWGVGYETGHSFADTYTQSQDMARKDCNQYAMQYDGQEDCYNAATACGF